MFYGCYDEYTIEYINPIGKKPIVIRILDCEKPPLKNFKNVLTIYVSDLDRDLGIGNVYNESHAKKINEFILNNDFDEILVHCTAGISRSPAVMAYIALILDDKKMFNEILSERHFIPNNLILQRSMNYSYIIKKDERKKILRNNFDKYKDITDYDPNTKILSIKL